MKALPFICYPVVAAFSVVCGRLSSLNNEVVGLLCGLFGLLICELTKTKNLQRSLINAVYSLSSPVHSMYYDPFLAAAAANADPSYRLQVRINAH